jgi:hypothetical protein
MTYLLLFRVLGVVTTSKEGKYKQAHIFYLNFKTLKDNPVFNK